MMKASSWVSLPSLDILLRFFFCFNGNIFLRFPELETLLQLYTMKVYFKLDGEWILPMNESLPLNSSMQKVTSGVLCMPLWAGGFLPGHWRKPSRLAFHEAWGAAARTGDLHQLPSPHHMQKCAYILF